MGTVQRSVHVDSADWQAAKVRAAQEGVTLSAIVSDFIAQYGKGQRKDAAPRLNVNAVLRKAAKG
jgi:hypothetical protein